MSSQTNGNSSVSTFSYDTANRTTDVWHKDSSATVLSHLSYGYDAGSNVTSRTDTNGDVTSFGYDNADQLTSESRSNGHSMGYSLAFTYDHNHNRATKILNSVTDTYAYDAHDKLTGISGGTNKTYGYDSNGNGTSVTAGTSVTSLTYDVENRVVSITYPSSATNTFAYNGEDLRTQKVDSSGTRNYVCDGSSPASAVLKDGAAVYTPGLSERRGSTSKFLHNDALGSTRGITDSSQTVTDSMLYDAFGNVLSRTGTTPTPFGFVGASQYQTDGDSGLLLLGYRYYDPSIGRFLSQDPIQAGTNYYAYCDNNPLGGIDPQGLDKIVVVHGNDENVWFSGAGYALNKPRSGDIVELDNPTKAQLIDALSDADEFYFWGHGGPRGGLNINNSTDKTEEWFSQIDLKKIIDNRKKRKKMKMKTVQLHACFSTAKADYVNTWLDISDEVMGYCSLTGQNMHWNNGQTYTHPISSDPNKDMADKKQKKKHSLGG